MLNYKKISLFFGILIMCNPLFAMEDKNQFSHLRYPQCKTCLTNYASEFDDEGYAQIGGYMNIQPEFMDMVLSGTPETLEIFAGQGQVLESILKKRNETSSSLSVKYTVVERYEANVKKIQEVCKSFKRKSDWVGYAQKDLVEFLETNLENKRNKYDHVFGGFALHIFGDKSFVAIVNGLFNVIKEDGYLYLTQHSFAGKGYDDEYIRNVESGQLLPFWVKGKFWSDPVTMENLLNAFGFKVIQNSLYQDINPVNSTTTKYLGIIAQKSTALYSPEKVRQYNDAADLFYQELDCSGDVSANKARLSPRAREFSHIWSIYDQKVGEAYDALKVYTRNINTKDLLLEKLEIHANNHWVTRALNTFLLQAACSQDEYENIFARVSVDGIVSKILKARFAFEEDETYQGTENSERLIQLKASVSAVKEKLIK